MPTGPKGEKRPADASDGGRPIAFGGASIYPDDIMFGDGEAVIVVPQKYADKVVAAEAQEVFRKLEIEYPES